MTTRFQFECPKRRLFHQQGRLLRLLLAFTVGVAIGIALTCEANAQDAITTATTVQVGTIAATGCYNGVTLLPANVWTLVLFDDAGNPCTTAASQLTGTCNPDSTWNWTLDGHLTFTTAPGYQRLNVRVQVWAGGGGGACYGGTSAPVYCDNQYYKLLKQDENYEYHLDTTSTYAPDRTGIDVAAPFSVLQYLLAPYFETPSDSNYQGIWIFAYPEGRPAVCQSVSYHDLGAN